MSALQRSRHGLRLATDTPRTAWLYGRVSTEHQRDAVSLDAQFDRGTSWTEDNGYALGGSFSDPAISGKRIENRPGLLAALDAVCASRGVLVIWSFSRMARNVEELLAIVRRLRKAGADVVSLTQNFDTRTAMGRYMLITWANLDELVPNLTGEHVADVLAYKRERGQKYGEIPYGKRLVPDPNCAHETDHEKACTCALVDEPEDARTLDLITALRLTRTWPQVAAELNRQAVTSKKGRAWTSANVRRVALRRVIAT